MREGIFDGGALEFVEGEAGFVFGPFDGGVGLDGREGAADAAEAGDGGGNLLLGVVVVRELDEGGAGEGIFDADRPVAGEGFGGDEGVDAGSDAVAAGFKHRRGVVLEVGFAVGGVAFVLKRFEGVDEAGVEAGRGVVGEAEVDGDAVGGLEADAVDLTGDAVGLLEEDGLGLRAVALDEFHALAGCDAVGLEENVEFALGALGVPSGFDGGGAFGADAGDVAEFAGFFGEDAEGVGAEGVDDFVGVGFADAGDEAAAEVFADAVDAGGELAFEGRDLELGAVLAVLRPLAGEVERLAAFDAGEGTDDGDLFNFLVGGGRGFYGRGARVGAKLRDGVVVFLVVENDAFEDAGEDGAGSGRRHGLLRS